MVPVAAAALLAAAPAPGGEVVGDESSLVTSLQAGTTHVGLRYRFEFVDQDGFEEDALASTARLRLNFQTGQWRNWRAFGEFDYVGELYFDEFNSGAGTSPDRTQYPVVADPEGADLNQLYADYTVAGGIARGWQVRLGRQRINLDDQRFIGGVGWRQNEQTFDAVSVTGNAFGEGKLCYGWIGNANRIYGDTVPAGDHRMNTHLLNLAWRLPGGVSLTPYLYYIDDDDEPAFSTTTAGLRVAGAGETDRGGYTWLAEYAWQSDAADAPVDFTADYWQLTGRWAPRGKWPAVRVGVASLGGDDTQAGAAFRTPLATLHAFQGWADQFLATPDAGVLDVHGGLSVTRGSWQFEGVYHDFSAQAGGDSYGRELDLSVARTFGSEYTLALIAAGFDSRSPEFADVTKAWIMFTAAW
ncbi:MAG TPA: alginate export family protein [Woeseiaceae bacterium]|nr:alginate export family protein [Woeseiaceae bacterium]